MIVVFGSINVDFVTRVPRVPAPGETVLGSTYAVYAGGKGANQALAARRAGASVALAGSVGEDPFAETVLAPLRAEGVDTSAVVRHREPTGAAFIAVADEGANTIVVAAGANLQSRASQIEPLGLRGSDTLILQREVPDREGEAAACDAKRRGARVILNLAPGGAVSESYLWAVDVLVMNETEAGLLAASLQWDGGDPDDVAAKAAERFSLAAIVTLGAAGAIGWHDGARWAAPAPKVGVVDTTGAGDAFVGAFAAATDRGLDFGAALAEGVAAGSLACTRAGAQPSLPRADAIAIAAAGIAVTRTARSS